MEQLATGLRRSGQRFVWVVREADNGQLEWKTVVGLVRRMDSRIRWKGWVGDIGSSFDWSVCEPLWVEFNGGAFECGGTDIAWPMQFDQPRNAEVLVGRWRVGVITREWEKRKELVKAGRVEEVVRLMMEGEDGKEMRERARKTGEDVTAAAGKGGSSAIDLDSFVSHINRSIEPKIK
ncbi:hypothetical protein HPP92_025755 [Vanilla planifolia]|uniref:Uncharacterized protein n=1 Tax=Vanilla planifolia TaxID=51239 RepID=A0A835UCM7_VANPL|nr:hypothetical protein HPP92_025755 [Vanilla planifolia]